MSEKNVCPKCHKEVSGNTELCPSCGTRLKERKTAAPKTESQKEASGKTSALACLVIAIVGIIVMFAYRAWLGGLIYLIAVSVSGFVLRNGYENGNSSSMPAYVMECIKGKSIWNKVLAIILVLAPIIVIVATYRWIAVDTVREVEEIYEDLL